MAIGIALNPGILLLDEPTANLDIATRREIMAVLSDMKDIIQTAVIATHDMQLVCQWAERIIVLCGGRVVADGPRDEIFARTDVGGTGRHPPAGDLHHGAGFRQASPVLYHRRVPIIPFQEA